MKDLLDLGAQMGLKDEDLKTFVREEQARMRDDREKERSERQAEKDREFQLQLEKERSEREREERQHQLELEEKRELHAVSEHKRKMQEIEVDHQFQALASERSHRVALESTHVTENHQPVKGPKLPAFDESKDNIDAYIQRFERYARAQNWNVGNWGSHLSALLTGKALDVFARLPPASALNYEELKEALYKRFEMTEDGFRKKFRTSKPDGSETFSQFSSRIDNYLGRWIELSKIEKTFDGLKDLFLREQFILCCSKELSLFLKERIPATVQEMARYADQFAEARATTSSFVTQKPVGFDRKPQFNCQQQSRSQGTPGSQRGQCYVCGRYGHKAVECTSGTYTPNRQSSDIHKGKDESKQVRFCDDNRNSNHYNNRNRVPSPMRYSPSFRDRDRNYGNQWQGRNRQGSSVVEAQKHVSHVNDCKIIPETVMPIVKGCVGDKIVNVLRDTGCGGVVIRKNLVKPEQMTGQIQKCVLADGSVVDADVAEVEVDSPYYSGTVVAWCFENPSYDLILGNIEGVRRADDPDTSWILANGSTTAVQTRSQSKKQSQSYKPLRVPSALADVSPEEFIKEQQTDTTLDKFRTLAKKQPVKTYSDGGSTKIYERNNLLYREFSSLKVSNGKLFHQLIVPKKYRHFVMKLAHETLMAGHLGVKKTIDRVTSEFYWPGVQADIRRFISSCDICQRTTPKGKIPPVPLGRMPLISEPFHRVAADIVGPLEPRTTKGNKYILTIIDFATRYPEAVALSGIETERVAEALVDVFSRVGVPREILTDQGTQFTSDVMKEVSRLLSLKRITTTPYHPMCNGLVEKFNGTLKLMLKRMCAERPKDWDKYLNALLFAYREVPQESLGFSPFELLYGHSVRGPMKILKELWTKEIPDEDVKSTYQYVIDLREKLEETCKIAHEQLEKAQKKQRHYYNRKTKVRQMKVGDKVLILLPTKSNKLLMQWKGPYDIVEKLGDMDYKVNVDGKLKTLHANLLKKYVERDDECRGVLTACAVSVIDCDDEDTDENQESIVLPPAFQTETYNDIKISEQITQVQLETVKTLCESFSDVLTDLPGATNLVEHKIDVTTTEPVRVKQYPLPFHTEKTIKEEVEKMLQLKVIEPSSSPYCAPVVIARKKDGTNRFCVDFRKLNSITVFDSEPMPNPESIFAKMSGKKYVSKIDLSKGYWQVPMERQSKQLTAFTTPVGLFQFTTMPFGLVNAPATFSRLMRKLLQDMDDVDNFIDDIMVFTDTWEQHLDVLRELFARLRRAWLTARPSKCFIAYPELDCLGHVIGQQRLQPEVEKIESLKNSPIPQTKKQVRSFLGLAGFYRKFIPNFSAIAIPLSDLTKKGQPNKVKWSNSAQLAFDTLKQLLCARPILKLPDFTEKFILRTDASEDGIGAVLLQTENEEKLPVAYASRKLKNSEKSYAVIEKECLAVVWGIQKFHQYLYGQEFILETDHQPLTYLNKSKTENSRLMRWALQLQQYRFRIVAIKGSENVGADYLSRQ